MKTFHKEYSAVDIVAGVLTVQHNLNRRWAHVAVWVLQPGGYWLEQATAWPMTIKQIDANTIQLDGNQLGLNPITPLAHVRVSA